MRRAAALVLALAPLGLTVAPAAHAAPASPPTGRLLVSLRAPRPGHAQAAAASAVVARAAALPAAPAVPQIGLVVVRPPAGTSLAALAARLRADPRVRAVAAEHRYAPRALPNDPALSALDASGSEPVQWWPEREGFPRAWSITSGAGALVGVIDTGVDGTHPELAGKVRRAVDFDDDPGAGPATVDEDGHGTHVASLACAATNNGFGLAGAGAGCGLVVEKSDLTDSSVARAIVDATDRRVDALNLSFGTDGRAAAPPAIVDALRYAAARRVVLVAAAADQAVDQQGDPANVLQPTGTGSDPTAGEGLTVTAATADGRRAAYAGFGSQISLAAFGAHDEGPAGGLLGAFPAAPTRLEGGQGGPSCGCRTSFEGDDRYALLQGTSMAAPQVAATGALMRHLNPDLPLPWLLRLLKQTASRPAGSGWSPDLGWGILDAGAAVDAARALDATPPRSTLTVAPARPRARGITLRLRGVDAGPPGVVVAGLSSIRVFEAIDGGPAVRIADTRRSTVRVPVRPGHRYTFFTRAVDLAGNVEPAPRGARGRTRVAQLRIRR